MRFTPRTVSAAVAVLALAFTAACGSSEGESPPGDSKISVVASTNVWGSVAQAVGGDAVTVKSIIDDPSGDPHSYESKPEDATALAGARLAVYNGGGYDEFFTKLVESSGQDARKIVAFDVSGKAGGAGGEEPNEHVWYDLPSVTKVAEKIAEELAAVAPDKRDTFNGNLEAFNNKVGELVNKLVEIGSAKPDARVLATEPIAVYLFETAGLTDATPEAFAEAIEEETDPPAEVVAEVTSMISGKQVAALVNNVQTETPVTKSLKDAARSAGVPVVDVTETLPEGVTSYVDWMTKQVDALANALK